MNRASHLRVPIHRTTIFIAVDRYTSMVTTHGMAPTAVPTIPISVMMIFITMGGDKSVTGGKQQRSTGNHGK